MLELCDAILGDHCPMPYRLIQLEIAQGENDECRYPPEAIEELADRHAGGHVHDHLRRGQRGAHGVGSADRRHRRQQRQLTRRLKVGS